MNETENHPFSKITQVVAKAFSENHVRMEFINPTEFRSNRLEMCIPSSGQIFRSLWEKSNAFVTEPMQVHELWLQVASECILVDKLTAVNTTCWEFAAGSHGSATGLPCCQKLKSKKTAKNIEVSTATILQPQRNFYFIVKLITTPLLEWDRHGWYRL